MEIFVYPTIISLFKWKDGQQNYSTLHKISHLNQHNMKAEYFQFLNIL